MGQGFQGKTAQQLYAELGIYANDVRQIAKVLHLGSEPFKPAAVEKMQAFTAWIKQEKLTVQQGLKQFIQAQPNQRDEPAATSTVEPDMDSSLPQHLQGLLVQAADRAQKELDQLDRVVYEQVELPAAQAAVDRILAADRNTEQLMLKLLTEQMSSRPGVLGGVVLESVRQFRPPQLTTNTTRYALPAIEPG